MKPKILLIGRNGQLGWELNLVLPTIGEVVAVGRDGLDLANPDDIRRVMRAARPAIVVNAAAYTAVDKAESEGDLARAINSVAPGVIAQEARDIGALVIHYSTDYVFDGRSNRPYRQDDSTNPPNVYGETKLEGEEAIRRAGVPHFIFRTSWVYATRGRNFLLTMLRLATQREELRVVSDQIGAPTLASELARATATILSKTCGGDNVLSAGGDLQGGYHLTAAGETSWHGFAEAIVAHAVANRQKPTWFLEATNRQPIIARRVIPVTTQDYPTPAKRPGYSVLSNERIIANFGLTLPRWQAQLDSLFAR